MFKFSRYNNIIRNNGDIYAHSGLSGALVKVTSERLLRAIEKSGTVDLSEFDSGMINALEKKMFIVKEDLDELAFLKVRSDIGRFNDSLHLTILPTLDCNMECTYCYEDRIPISMSPEVKADIKKFTGERLRLYNGKKLQVDWYGGEPLMELDTVLDLSNWMIAESEKHGITYNSKIVSNGILLTPDAARALVDMRVTKCQITIDCTKESHDQRRILKSGGANYDTIIENVKFASQIMAVAIRMNIDKNNECYIESAIDEFDNHGLFSEDRDITVYIAPAMPATGECAHVVVDFFSPKEFLDISKKFLNKISRYTEVKGRPLYFYHQGRSYCCGAVSMNSYLINPKGNIYKCALDVYKDGEAVGHVSDGMSLSDVLTPKMNTWLNYTPFDLDGCRQCRYLPVCLGGCPHSRIHNNKPIINYNCKSFKENFDYSLKMNIERNNNISKK